MLARYADNRALIKEAWDGVGDEVAATVWPEKFKCFTTWTIQFEPTRRSALEKLSRLQVAAVPMRLLAMRKATSQPSSP